MGELPICLVGRRPGDGRDFCQRAGISEDIEKNTQKEEQDYKNKK